MAYPPEFLKLVDEFIHLANRLAEGGNDGEASAAILFAAGRYNAFNFVSRNGTEQIARRLWSFMFRSTVKRLSQTWKVLSDLWSNHKARDQ
jgi:Protein of unknown function (DUF3144)